MKIYAHLALTQNESMALKAKVSNHTLLIGQDLDPKERKGAFHTCDIALGNVPSDWIKSSGKLRWMQLESTGFGSYLWLRDSPLKEKLRVTYLKGMFGIPVAETIVAGVLCLYRGLDRLVNLQAKKQWMLAPIRPTLRILHGQRVLIAGAGAIGSHAKTLFEGFGCEVTTLGRKGGSGDIDSSEAFDRLLPTADVVVSCLPATPQTNQLFDKARFNLFKPDAIFVNVGRGSAVDETALIEALQSKTIWGSVVDVSHVEPLPADHPFWTCPNTLVTQHTSGGNRGEILKKIDIFTENLERFEQGKALVDPIDLDKGY